MIKTNLLEFYVFGYNYYILVTGAIGADFNRIIELIQDYLDFLKDNKLLVTNNVIHPDLPNLRDEFKKKPKNEIIKEEDSSRLKTIIKSADKTLDAELTLREAYILTEKIYSLENLLDKIERLFAAGVYSMLPKTAKVDIDEAGKCIAFELPTSAAFHLMRATEATLRMYYKTIVKKKRLDDPLWATMITQLRNKQKSSKTLLDALDNIRFNFRNPTSHPEATFQLDEAQDLFAVCIDSLNRMVKEINKLNQAHKL